MQDQIIAAAARHGVDASLALAVAQRESGFNQGARGAAGEVGVFQLMPATAAELGVDPYNLAQNIEGGVRYLAQMFQRFGGDPFKAVAAYNAGPGRVGDAIRDYGAQWFDHIPASTQDYVTDVVPAQQLPGAPAPVEYAGIIPLPTLPPQYQPLLFGLALAGVLLVGYSYAAGEPEWD